MEKLFIVLLLLTTTASSFAQSNPDSLAYELQRKKINSMLEIRSQRFSQYDESLSEHTGIFGLQTKKDIRRSNDILMDIVKTDNEIFLQTKILLDYRVFQQAQAQSRTKEVSDKALAYMATINKLRDQLQKLKKESDENEKNYDKTKAIQYIIIGILFLSLLYFVTRKSAVKV